MKMIIEITYELFQVILPEQMYGVIKNVGHLNKEPILYGDPNLLKIGQLYYTNAGLNVYSILRLVSVSPTTYYFEPVESIDGEVFNDIENNGFGISEQELNKVRKIGKLFNKPIYTGDINLIDNGNYYYHKGFPFLTTVTKDKYNTIGIMFGTNLIEFKNLSGSKKFVDLALPSGTLWDTENLKISNQNQSYFAWGDVTSHDETFSFNQSDYTRFGSFPNYNKYNNTDKKTTLELVDDAVNVNKGANNKTSWHMPSVAQVQELLDNTTHERVPNYKDTGVSGTLLTSKNNGKKIFFPDSGLIHDGNSEGGPACYLWTNQLDYNDTYVNATCVLIDENGVDVITDMERYTGMQVRGVIGNITSETESKETKNSKETSNEDDADFTIKS